jgi:hypothetical protein
MKEIKGEKVLNDDQYKNEIEELKKGDDTARLNENKKRIVPEESKLNKPYEDKLDDKVLSEEFERSQIQKNGNINLNHISLNINLEKITKNEKAITIENNKQQLNQTMNSSINLGQSNLNESIINPKGDQLKSIIYSKPENNFLNSFDFTPKINEFIKMDDILTLSVEVADLTKCYFTLHQPQSRFREDIDDYKTPLAFIIVAKYIESSKTYIYTNSEFINWEKLIVECYLSPGEYHIFAKSYWCQTKNYELIVSTYAENPVGLYNLTKEEYPSNWLEKIMTDIAKKNPDKIYFSREEITTYGINILFNGNNFSGFSVFYYENNSAKGNMVVKINFSKIEGIKFLNIDKKEFIHFIIPPKKSRIIIMQIISLPWHCKLEYDQEMWIEYPVQHLVKKYVQSERVEKKIIEEGLYLYEISHDRGYVLMVDNFSGNYYKCEMQFSKMKNYEIENFSDIKNVNFPSEPKSQKFVNIKGNVKDLEKDFKLKYKQNFVKI